MKFAKQLQEYELAEYKGQYLPYKELKNALADIKEQYGDNAFEVQAFEQPELSPGRWIRRKLSWYEGDGGESIFPSSPKRVSSSMRIGAELISPASAWLRNLEREAFRVAACMKHGFTELETQFHDLRDMMPHEGVSKHETDRYFEMRVIEALGQVSEALVRLREFAEMNHAALYKILKKHDKTLGTSTGLKQHLPRLVEKTGFDKLDQFAALESRIQEKLSQMSSVQGLDASSKVSCLAAGLGTGAGDDGQSKQDRRLCFFAGAACALALTIFVLIALPPLEQLVKDPKTGELMYSNTFNATYFFSGFALYRSVLCIALCLWSMGAVARVSGNKGINHIFLLGLDPRSRVSDRFLFGLAAFLTALWILMFGLFVVDYKWMIIPLQDEHRPGVGPRASFHYVLYPIALIVIVFLMPFIPSTTCRCRFKLGILKCMGRTTLAPAFTVSFGDNIMADVLTSLTRVLQDIPLSACYLASHHPQLDSDVRRFDKYGDVCPQWVPFRLLPIIAALPLWFRMMQCARRFYGTHATKHLWNCGKYVTCLAVVAVGTVTSDFLVLFISSSAAIVYCATWDVAMDWGLGFPELAFLAHEAREVGERRHSYSSFLHESITPPPQDVRGNAPTAEKTAEKQAERDNMEDSRTDATSTEPRGDHQTREELTSIASASTGACTDELHGITVLDSTQAGTQEFEENIPPPSRQSSPGLHSAANGKAGHSRSLQEWKRLFSPQIYWLAVIFNILARCSWVFTLLPTKTLAINAVQRSLLHTVIAALEIVRRSVWVLLRMEHEQVANASGFRALLWVPRKFNEDSASSKGSELRARRHSGSGSRKNSKSTFEAAAEPLLQA